VKRIGARESGPGGGEGSRAQARKAKDKPAHPGPRVRR